MSKSLSTFEFISSLRRLNIQISVEGDRMRCNAPKGTLTPVLKAQLSERKSEIVAFFQTTNTQPVPEIKPISRKGKLPLSFAQQRLWFLDQLEGESATYTVPQVLELKGTLDTAALTRALSEIIQRHESLRTTFQVVEGEPVQVILPAESLDLEPIDLRPLAESDRTQEVRRLANESACKPFNLACDRPIRIQLITQDQQTHILLVTMHHIVSDGWSMGIFTQELSTLYRDFLAGKSASLPRLNVQYADFAHWQRQYLKGRVLTKQLSYWRNQLADAPDLLSLPTDYCRPAVQSYQGASLPFQLSADTSQRLLALSKTTGSTLYMTLMAAYATLLYRYSQSEDIVIGSPIANRTRQEIEPLIGFFANTLPLRINVSNEPTFLSLLKHIKPLLLAAYEHQDIPFEKLVEELNPTRNLSYHPLFQVMFVLRNSDPEALDLPGIQLKSRLPQKTTSKFDLTLSVLETPKGLTGKWQYSSDLFLPETIQRLNDNFKSLLKSIAKAPEQAISQLPILSTTEQQQIEVWNHTQANYDLSKAVHQRFEAQALRTPEAVAVVFENTQLTYRELNEKANQLAHYLRQKDVTAESLVGLCLHRSLEMMIAVFAVMKAGGAYVPIEPNQPTQRIAGILAEAQPTLVLTHSVLAEQLAQQAAALFCLDTQWQDVASYSTQNPIFHTNKNNLVYVLYTSGSTGRPKGVMVEHRNLLNYIDAVKDRLRLEDVQQFASVSTLAADLGHTAVFPALCGGTAAGCLHIISEERVLDPNALAAYFEAHPIDCLKIVPSHLEALLSAKHPAAVIPKQRLVLGGEPCSDELIQRVRQLAPSCVIFNHYGPTEATVGAIAGQLPAQNLAHLSVPPLGLPLANVQIHILDQHQKLVPVGVPGEIYISGAGVARGYLNRAELTAQKFVDLKFVDLSLADASETAPIRCYKTGDLGKYNPDGSIEFIGRADDQVKIRGFRIELGEVVAALRHHPALETVAVLVQGSDPANQQLVAYVVPHQPDEEKTDGEKTSVDTAELSQFLKKQLPDYMIPSVFVAMEQLPFTPNGKLDRQALPVPKLSDRTAQTSFTPPTTPTEEALITIWCECLNLKQAGAQACEQIGAQDNFFNLGGHSLLATQVISRIRDRFALELPLRTVFESPTVTELATAIDQAASQQKKGRRLQTDAITPVTRDKPLVLSFAQQRLWFLDQLEGQSATYNVPTVLEVEGDLKIESLAAALSEIVRRHEVLRTTFQVVDTQPVQMVLPPAPLLLPVVDLKRLSQSDRATQLEKHINREAHTPFDLSRDRPIRATLITLQSERHVLLVTMHHIVSDGWSRGILMREISTLYRNFCKGEDSSLPALPIQYADFASWQRQWLQGKTLSQQLSYWQQQLADAPSLLELPSDHLRPAVQTFNGGRVRFELDSTLSGQLTSLAQQRSTTLFMTLLSAFSVLLHRYTHADDVVVGSPIANRTRRELEPLIGFFTNTLILRTRITETSTFVDLLKQVRQTALEAYAHQDLPFEKLVEELNPERNLSYHPIFQVMFILQNAASETFDLPGVTLTPLQKERAVAKFDLTLSLSETPTGMRGVFEYNSDLFEAATIQRLVKHFRQLLHEIVKSPTLPVSQLSLLNKTEKQKMLASWNNTQVCFDQKQLIHQQFEAQVAKSPHAVAVLYEKQSLTYQALNDQAQQLANYLQQKGVGPETLVGICVERSPMLLVGLLGILKAGGAYVPIDPTYPQQRIADTLEDANVALILTQSHLSYLLPKAIADVVHLDSDWTTISSQNSLDPSFKLSIESAQLSHSPVSADNLAYVIYTSGSTGKPKGVQITHGAVANFLSATAQKPGIGADDTLVAVTTIAFDISVLELYLPLVAGGKVVLAPSEVTTDARQLAQLIYRCRATIMQATPATWQMLIADGWQGAAQLKMLCGGEALAKDLADRLLTKGCELWNMYGPTEATVWTAACQITSDQEAVPVAGPLANTQLYVLDERLNPVPIGVSGEVHIGGAGLARGYLNRPALTAEKFVPDPFSGQAGSRLYKTGDLGCFRADGSLSFLGRIDHQVKLRGFRIELGEVEAALNEHPAVQSSVAIVCEENQSNKQLVAYWVPANSGERESDRRLLRQHLRHKLPLYMMPSVLVELDALPLTDNGKVNRKALPEPETISQTTAYVAPTTELQRQLVSIWQDVLALKKIGIHDNFFELGGHSLLATQVISRIQSSLNIQVTLRSMFEAPTLVELAASIAAQQPEVSELAIKPVSRNQPLPLSFAQRRLWFLDQLEGSRSPYILSRSILLPEGWQVEQLKESLAHIINRHEVLRTTIHTIDSEPVQAIAPQTLIQSNIALPVTNLSALSTPKARAAVAKLIKQASDQPFDLSRDSLIRFNLVLLPDHKRCLLVTIHHIATDGWSMNIFTQELFTTYTDLSQKRASTLPPLPIQYADFASWQRQWLQGEPLNQQLSYWQQQLADIPELLTLPSDHPRPAVQSFKGGRVRFTLDKTLTQQLNALTQQNNVTLFMTLLTGFSVLLHRYTDLNDIVVGSPIANRNRKEIEPLIGFFANTLILRTRIDGGSTFVNLLKAVRQTALEAYEHQDLPFEKLVEELNPERNLSYHPLFQVMFSLQNNAKAEKFNQLDSQPDSQPTAPLEPFEIEQTTSKFDLTLSMRETADSIQGIFEYNSDLFEVQTIQRLIENFCRLLQSIVQSPTSAISLLPLLSDSEKQQQFLEWNNTEIEFDHKTLIHQQFEAQVAASPEAIAVVYKQQSLTYRELNQQAQQLANYLQQQGVGPEDLVGLCVDRSPLLLVGLLGVLKAGGAYVPIDPTHPKARISTTLSDANVSLVLTQSHLAERLPKVKATAVYLDRDWDKITQCSADPVKTHSVSPDSVTSDSLAYVIYTSGSTGKPKGVQITHGAVTNFLSSAAQHPGLTANDTIIALTTIAFDISVLELYLPLVVGAKVVIASPEVAVDVSLLAQLIERSQASVVQATPATWQMLIANGWQGSAQLKMICGGEALSRELADQLLSRGKTLWNGYGPTEATVYAATCQVTAGTGPVTIAHPFANMQVYVLDEQLNPVPIGIAGEVHIGGAGVARGYLNRPALTAEKFVADPFSHQTGARLYKTGDLACFRADGSLLFLGRIDHQVKLRGFRIELGEIEAALCHHPAVQNCVVIVREDTPGDKRLVAYWSPTSSDKSGLEPHQLRQHLKQLLPMYMVPSAFIELEQLPLTANAKVDRVALPAPKTSLQATEYVAPTTEMEQQLVGIWQTVLAADKVGIHDNFFDLGGHSLLAVHLVNQIQKVLAVKVPLSILFRANTVAQLTEALAEIGETQNALSGSLSGTTEMLSDITETPLVLLRGGDTQQPPVFWVHPVGGSVFCYSKLVNEIAAERPFYGLQARRLNQRQQLTEHNIESIAADYLDQIRQVQPQGPYCLGGWSMGGVIAFEMAQQLLASGETSGETVEQLIMIDSGLPGRSRQPISDQSLSPKQPSEKQLLLSFVRHFNCSSEQFEQVRSALESALCKTDNGSISDSPMPRLLKALKLNALIPSSMTASELAVLFNLFSHHQRILSEYQPQPYPKGLQLIECQQPRIHRHTSLLSQWQPLVKGTVAFSKVPGDHYSIMRSPYVSDLAKTLTKILDHRQYDSP